MAAAVMGLGTTPIRAADAGPSKSIEDTKDSTSATVPQIQTIPILRKNAATARSSTVPRVSITDVAAPTEVSDLPLREIPGTYGTQFLGIGAIKDRLDFHWFQGVPKFYQARKEKFKSTVYRTNMPPGPPFFPDPRVIVVLDEKSYLPLFDMSKVEKKDVFTGTWMPSVSLNGGYRVLPYLDPSEPKHALLKKFVFEMIKSSGPRIFPEFAAYMEGVFTSWEAALKKDGKVDFMTDLQPASFRFMLKAFTKRDPFEEGENSLGKEGLNGTLLWLLANLAPITEVPVPAILAPLVELFLHTFRIPFFLVKSSYTKLVNFYRTYGSELLDFAEELGLEREEALHNLVMVSTFNAWGGLKVTFPGLIARLGGTSAEYQSELAAEVQQAVADNGGKLGLKALARMPLVESAVYEALRIDPPVPYQYGKAKEDFVLESSEGAFQIKKGEMLHGFMPVACRDPTVFRDPETYQPKRFVGDEGKALLKYVLWSNGPQTEEPSVDNKHCAGKDIVLTICRLLVATIFLKYDFVAVDPSNAARLTSLRSSTSGSFL